MNPIEQILDAMDKNPAISVGMGAVLVFLIIVGRINRKETKAERLPGRSRSASASVLDRALLWWTQHDPFTVRDLLNGGLSDTGEGRQRQDFILRADADAIHREKRHVRRPDTCCKA